MMLNVVLLIVTIFMLYVGYTYKALFVFIAGMLVDDCYRVMYKSRAIKTRFNKERKCHTMKFFMGEQEYILVIPESNITTPKTRILALSGSCNKTDYLVKLMGPSMNFFGSVLTPSDLGLSSLSLWVDRVRFSFGPHDIIEFTSESRERVLQADSDTDESEEEEEETERGAAKVVSSEETSDTDE